MTAAVRRPARAQSGAHRWHAPRLPNAWLPFCPICCRPAAGVDAAHTGGDQAGEDNRLHCGAGRAGGRGFCHGWVPWCVAVCCWRCGCWVLQPSAGFCHPAAVPRRSCCDAAMASSASGCTMSCASAAAGWPAPTPAHAYPTHEAAAHCSPPQRRWRRGWRQWEPSLRMRSQRPSRRRQSSSSARCGRAATRGGQRATRIRTLTESSFLRALSTTIPQRTKP